MIVLNAHPTRHEKTKHGLGVGDKLRCPMCTFTTENGKASLNMHVRMSHSNSSKDHVCADCNFTTKFLWALRRHNTMVHAEGR